MEGARKIETRIEPADRGARLDRFLAARFTYRSRTEWQNAVSRGEIEVNALRVRPSKLLREGDLVAFRPPGALLAEPEVDAAYTVIADFRDYFAVNKPGRLPAHPAGRFFKNTLLALLERDFGSVHLVNRLDRETSGVTLAAKTPAAARKLSKLFSAGKTVKRYVALVFGEFPAEPFTAEGFLVSDPESAVRKKRLFLPALSGTAPPPASESAATAFRLLGSNGRFSAVEAIPKTGRLHQIRATLLSLGFPLVGDKLYGPDETFYLDHVRGTLGAEALETLVLPRQALHAAELSFVCPFEKTEISLKAPLPSDISGLYRKVTDAIL